MAYIKRDIEDKIISLSKEYSCILITGPRQVGKTTVLRQLMDDNREYVTLDDMDERSLAKRDPAMFLQIHSTPIMIDEVQYAPELFSYIKMEIAKELSPEPIGSLDHKRSSLWSWHKNLWPVAWQFCTCPACPSTRFADQAIAHHSP